MKKKRPMLDSVQRMARGQRLIVEQERDLAEYIKHCPSKAALWPCPIEAFAEKLMNQQPPSDQALRGIEETNGAEKPKQPAVCPVCMGEGKLWCAMCGTWGNHQSGECPELVGKAGRVSSPLESLCGLTVFSTSPSK